MTASPLRNQGRDGECQDAARADQWAAFLADDIRKVRKVREFAHTDTLGDALDGLAAALTDALSDFTGQTESLPRYGVDTSDPHRLADIHAYKQRAM